MKYTRDELKEAVEWLNGPSQLMADAFDKEAIKTVLHALAEATKDRALLVAPMLGRTVRHERRR